MAGRKAIRSYVKINLVLRGLLLRWAANGLGLWIADRLISGVEAGDNGWVIVIAAFIFSLVNMVIRPIVTILTLPAVILSLGLFMLVINALMLYLVTVIYPEFVVASFGAAVLTVIIVWLANYGLSMLFDQRKAPQNA